MLIPPSPPDDFSAVMARLIPSTFSISESSRLIASTVIWIVIGAATLSGARIVMLPFTIPPLTIVNLTKESPENLKPAFSRAFLLSSLIPTSNWSSSLPSFNNENVRISSSPGATSRELLSFMSSTTL